MLNLEFVTASHRPEVLKENLLLSPILNTYGLTVQTGFTNIPNAYNEVRTRADLVCYVHNDVYLPPLFESQLEKFIAMLPNTWEVLGVAGVTGPPKQNYGFICDRGKMWGKVINSPVKVDTLDELLLITRGNIKFDPLFEQDFYGADICIGREAYVIPCFVNHNSSREFGGRTEKFYEAERLFKNKYLHKLPIVTTCSILTL